MTGAGRILLGLMVAVLLATWGTPARQARAEEEQGSLLLGLIPEENIFKQMKRYLPLGDYLGEQIGMKVRFTILSRYPHIITRFTSRGLDGAFFGIFTSVLAEETLGVIPVARPIKLDGTTTARSYIFVRRDSGITTLAELKGRRGAFVDQVTATGYLYFAASLKRAGLGRIDQVLREFTYTGSHDSVIYTVLSGRADVGAVKGRVLENMADRDPLVRDELLVLDRSEALPDNTLYLRRDLPLELKIRIQQVLLEMHESAEGREVLARFEAQGFAEARSEDFAPVRAMARSVGLDLKHFEYDY